MTQHSFLLLLLCFLTAGSWGCSPPSNASNPPPPPQKAQGESLAACFSYVPDSFGERIGGEDIEYAGGGTLFYHGYQITKAVKKERMDSSEYYADIEYAVLRRGGRIIATFDGEPGHHSEVRFTLFPLLGGDSRQLIVEQTSNRFWRYWVVSLSPRFEVIYDSGEYGVIYELKTADPDGDGRLELIQSLGTFWFFSVPENVNTLNNVNSPRPEVFFKYDAGGRKYLPANQMFQSVVLKDIEARVEKTRELNRQGSSCFPAVLDVMVRYLYAGKDKEAWAFFEQEYHSADKEILSTKIQDSLRDDAVYESLYRR